MAECCINDLVVPEEQDNVRRIWKTEIPRFFEEGMLKQSWKYRLKDEHRSEEWYELTLLRGGHRTSPPPQGIAAVAAYGTPCSRRRIQTKTGSVRTAGFFMLTY